MKHFTLLILFTILFSSLYADEITPQQAQNLAANFYRIQNGFAADQVNLVEEKTYNGRAIIYTYQVNEDDGFVIISGDDQTYPILGYSLKGSYVYANQASQFSSWMEKYFNEIVFIVNADIPATTEIQEAWERFSSEETLNHALRASVGPLVNLGWDQSPNYNADCPFDSQYNGLTVTGCVATAMAMIMKFWEYPAQGSGFHSFNSQNYGTLSANFANSSYNWSSMPAQVNSANTEVAKLMYQCGVSVEMSYGVGQTGGSAAYVVNAASPILHCSEYAYKTYFGYDASSVSGVLRSSYSNQQWISTLKTELDEGRPMQYAGIGSGGGHTWVCDGYDNNDMFHMNWGWSNQNDGYFNLNSLNPSNLGTGGGDGGFNANQQAVIGIKPPGGNNPPAPASVNVSSFINIFPGSTVDFASPFDVYADISNSGNSSLTADFAAVLLNPEGYVIDFIQTFPNETINANSFVSATFSTTGLLATPGDYYVAIIYKQGSGNWQVIQAGSGISNPVPLTVAGPYNTIQLNSNMILNPSQFVAGQAASVNVNLYNDGFFDWLGTYYAALYDLEGNYVTTIGEMNESQGLPPGFTYNPPYLTFSTSNLDVIPGTYILAMLGQESGFSDAYLLGGSQFTNPITITVMGPTINPDSYESNETALNAYTFATNFSGNNLMVTTVNANLHIGTDIDFYKVSLPAGFSYLITPRLHDSYNSGNGSTYTVDGVFTYDSGLGLSPAIDDVAPEPIALGNGGEVIFKVSPYFSGNTGSYQLELNISRSVLSVGDDKMAQSISLYPNPANDNIFIDNLDANKEYEINVINSLGQSVQSIIKSKNNQKVQLETSSLKSGIYFMRITSKGNIITKSFVIK
ncbi:MAG: thiol protease/hemagglutinin PrtT [Bacteroidia bacterium]